MFICKVSNSEDTARREALNILKFIKSGRKPIIPKIVDSPILHDVKHLLNRASHTDDFNCLSAVFENGSVCLLADFINELQKLNLYFDCFFMEIISDCSGFISLNIENPSKRDEAYDIHAQKAYHYCSTKIQNSLIEKLSNLKNDCNLVLFETFITTRKHLNKYALEMQSQLS